MNRIVATYTIHVTLHEGSEAHTAAWIRNGGGELPEPTNGELERIVKAALYDGLDYYPADSIGVRSERTDR